MNLGSGGPGVARGVQEIVFLLVDDFRNIYRFMPFAWFDGGYTLMRQRQSRWSPDHVSTCPLHLAVTCSVSAALEEHKKLWI